MDEFEHPGSFRIARQFVAQPVFDGFHIVVGGGLDGLDRKCIVLAEICVERVQLRDGGSGKRRDVRRYPAAR